MVSVTPRFLIVNIVAVVIAVTAVTAATATPTTAANDACTSIPGVGPPGSVVVAEMQ